MKMTNTSEHSLTEEELTTVGGLIDQLSVLRLQQSSLQSQKIKLINSSKSLLRSALGFSSDEQTGLKESAAKAFKAFLDDKTDVLDDEQTQATAIVYPTLNALREAIVAIEHRENEVTTSIEETAKQLPVWQWAKPIKGFSAKGLGILVGEVGSPASYPHHKMLFKRLGLGVYNGRAPSSWKSNELKKDQWIEMGYNAKRRSASRVYISNVLIMHKNQTYYTLFVERKEHEKSTHPDLTPKHIDNRARRYAEKQFVRDFYEAWFAHTPNH